MMIKNVCACLLLASGTSMAFAGAPGDDANQPASKSPPPSQSTTAKPDAPAATPAAPTIVVHEGAAPTHDGDGRVEVGGLKISMAGWSPDRPAQGAPRHDANTTTPPTVPAPRADGAIVIPDNTMGPGEPVWSIREREAAERTRAAAEADIARTEAQRAPHSSDGFGYPIYSGFGWLYRHGRFGLRGPVTTTITRFDDLGSTAQRAFAEAAYPRLNGSQDARDRAVSQFGRDATPPIVRIQNDVDRAHMDANREHPNR